MPLTRPYPIDKAWPNGIDLRKQLSGLIPREGLFPDPVTVDQGVAYANGTWNVGARPFVSAFKRGGAAFTQAYGTALGTNDSSATAWVLSANASGSTRVDRLWVRWIDPTQGEGLTTPGGETVPRAVPIFGVTAGTPTAQPWPAGVQKIAEASIPNGAASIAAATITQVYDFAYVIGGVVWLRNATEQAAWEATPLDGSLGYRIDTDVYVGRAAGATHLRGGQLVQMVADQPASVVGGSPVRFGTLAKNAGLSSPSVDDYFQAVTGVSGGIRVLKAGMYSFEVCVNFPASIATNRGFLQIGDNGTPAWRTRRGPIGVAEDTASFASGPIKLAANDVVPFFVLQGGAAMTMGGATVLGTYLGRAV